MERMVFVEWKNGRVGQGNNKNNRLRAGHTHRYGHETHRRKYLSCTNARPSPKVVSQCMCQLIGPGKWILLFLFLLSLLSKKMSADSSRTQNDWLELPGCCQAAVRLL